MGSADCRDPKRERRARFGRSRCSANSIWVAVCPSEALLEAEPGTARALASRSADAAVRVSGRESHLASDSGASLKQCSAIGYVVRSPFVAPSRVWLGVSTLRDELTPEVVLCGERVVLRAPQG